MQQGEYKLVPFLGINTEPLDDQSPDGLCSKIFNLKPKGVESNPFWVPFEVIKSLTNGTDPFTYEHGIENISGAFWQIRNYVGEFKDSESESLKRLIVLCDKEDRHAIDIIDPVDWGIVKSYTFEEGEYSFSFARIGEITAINVIRNEIPYKLYYLKDDLLIENGWPEMPEISAKLVNDSFTEEEELAGATAGIKRLDEQKQYFMVCWAFRLFDGTYIKHSNFTLFEVTEASIFESTYAIPEFTNEGYTDGLENSDLWESLISGVSLFCTLPHQTKKKALDDGLFYEVGYMPFLDRLPESQWETSENPNIFQVNTPYSTWPTFLGLNIDNFSHHRFCANVADSYNSILLLGGSAVDFTLPKNKLEAEIEFDEGGSYTDYFTENSTDSTINSQYFTNSGVETTISEYDYENRTVEIVSNYSPLSGREFKDVVILETSEVADVESLPDGSIAPIHEYNANFISGNLQFNVTTIESTYNNSMSIVDPYMKIRLEIGPVGEPADEFLEIEATWNGTSFLFNVNVQVGIPSEFQTIHIVTIKTEDGTYQRISEYPINTATLINLPLKIWYPDRRAVNYRILFNNGTEYELILDKKLIQHPVSNYSYAFLLNSELTYTLGEGDIVETVDESVNKIHQWVKNRIQASETNMPFLFLSKASYRIGSRERDSIQGFGVNTIDISQGQFGQYPLYVFSDKSVYALEQTGDPTIVFGRIVPINTFNGLNNREAICNAENIIIAADKNYIYSLVGLNAERIDRPISGDTEYDQFLNGIRLAYHKERDYEEIIFSNPSFEYSWVYNMRYKFWYQWGKSFRLFFQDQPILYGIDTDDSVLDFSRKETNESVEWELQTRKVNLGSRYISKRLLNSQIRAEFVQPETDGIYDELSVDVDFQQSNGSNYLGCSYHRHEKISKDLWIKTKYGSFQTMEVTLAGKHQNNGTYIHQLELNYENRYTNRVRR
jgi:hypothetical protein